MCLEIYNFLPSLLICYFKMMLILTGSLNCQKAIGNIYMVVTNTPLAVVAIKQLQLYWYVYAYTFYHSKHLLQNNIMIKRLNLSWNGFGVEGARELGKALMENTTLQELDVT